MITFKEAKTVYFDCDNTLVMWSSRMYEPHWHERAIEVGGYWLVPHVHHVNALKNHKEDGCTIVVWSQGGADWAKCVVDALGLEAWVDVCLRKPDIYYDDITAQQFMAGAKRYLDE